MKIKNFGQGTCCLPKISLFGRFQYDNRMKIKNRKFINIIKVNLKIKTYIVKISVEYDFFIRFPNMLPNYR